MKFFLDTEFSERGANFPLTLISIGIVDERGGEFYGINKDFREEDCNEWVKANVLPQLYKPHSIALPLSDLALIVRHWIEVQAEDSTPEFWGYYSDYDWVVFCQMFGTMMDLPLRWPMYCRDIKQLCDDKGNPELPKQIEGEHNALQDAHWNRVAYVFLMRRS